jgi:drug/metabolite transporter (DMT)-like permease
MKSTSTALFAALIVIGVAWGATMPLSKMVVNAGYRHFGIIFWQQVVCTAILFVWLALRRRPLPLKLPALLRYLFIALFGTMLPNAGSYIAQERLPAGLVSICFALIPMLALPLAIATRLERPEPLRMLGILAGLTGVLLIALPEASLPDRSALAFLPFALGAALCYAIEATGLGKLGTAELDPVQLLAGASVLSLVLALPAALLTHSWVTPGQAGWEIDALLVLVAATHTLSYAGYIWVVGQGGAVFAAQVSYLVTGSAVFWSMILLGERYSLWVWAALAVVFGGLFLVQPRPRRDTVSESFLPHPVTGSLGPDDLKVFK